MVRVACKAKETAIDIAEFGALGPRGADGETGVAGPQGPPGAGFSLTLGTSQSHRAYPIMSGIVDLPAGTHTFGYGQTVSGNWGSSGGGGGQTTLLMLGN